MRTIKLDEYHELLKSQGVPTEHMAFKCPMCGTIQSACDLMKAGAGENFPDVEKYLAFSCVGRWTHGNPPPKVKGSQFGCNWTLGGLFQLHEFEVETPDGKKHPLFEPSTPEEAQKHMRENLEDGD